MRFISSWWVEHIFCLGGAAFQRMRFWGMIFDRRHAPPSRPNDAMSKGLMHCPMLHCGLKNKALRREGGWSSEPVCCHFATDGKGADFPTYNWIIQLQQEPRTTNKTTEDQCAVISLSEQTEGLWSVGFIKAILTQNWGEGWTSYQTMIMVWRRTHLWF